MTETKFSLSDSIVRGRIELPPSILVYGAPSAGKTSFASQFPGVYFLATVNVDRSGTNEFDIPRVLIDNCVREPKQAKCATCGMQRILDAIDALASEESCQTIAIDHLGGIQEIISSHLLATCPKGKKNMTEAHGGFMKAWILASAEMKAIIERLDVARKQGKQVVFIAHSLIKKVRDPELESWDQHQLGIRDELAMPLREWLDCAFYVNFDRHVFEEGGRVKAVSSGRRLLHTQPPNSMAYFAKDRFSLPATIDLSYAAWRKAYEGRPTVDSVRREILVLAAKLPADKRAAVLEYQSADVRSLLTLKKRIETILEKGDGGNGAATEPARTDTQTTKEKSAEASSS